MKERIFLVIAAFVFILSIAAAASAQQVPPGLIQTEPITQPTPTIRPIEKQQMTKLNPCGPNSSSEDGKLDVYIGDIYFLADGLSLYDRSNYVCAAKLKRAPSCDDLQIFVNESVVGRLADSMCAILSSALGSPDRKLTVSVDNMFNARVIMWEAAVPPPAAQQTPSGEGGTVIEEQQNDALIKEILKLL